MKNENMKATQKHQELLNKCKSANTLEVQTLNIFKRAIYTPTQQLLGEMHCIIEDYKPGICISKAEDNSYCYYTEDTQNFPDNYKSPKDLTPADSCVYYIDLSTRVCQGQTVQRTVIRVYESNLSALASCLSGALHTTAPYSLQALLSQTISTKTVLAIYRYLHKQNNSVRTVFSHYNHQLKYELKHTLDVQQDLAYFTDWLSKYSFSAALSYNTWHKVSIVKSSTTYADDKEQLYIHLKTSYGDYVIDTCSTACIHNLFARLAKALDPKDLEVFLAKSDVGVADIHEILQGKQFMFKVFLEMSISTGKQYECYDFTAIPKKGGV